MIPVEWVPIELQRPWHERPTLYVIEEILKNLKCVKHVLGLLIAAILGMIPIATVAAMARMALHKSLQTVHFVQEWHKDANVLWTTQQKIDGKLASQVADLQQSVISLGDQLISLQKQVRPRCDWVYLSFCVTAFKYDKAQFNWDKVKQGLLNQGNISVEKAMSPHSSTLAWKIPWMEEPGRLPSMG